MIGWCLFPRRERLQLFIQTLHIEKFRLFTPAAPLLYYGGCKL